MVSRGSKSQTNVQGGRDVSITPPSLTTLLRPSQNLYLPPLKYSILDILPQDDTTFPDRRAFRPDKSIRPPFSVTRAAARIRAGYHPRSLNFQTPRLVALCVKRKMRREVLHAFSRTGKGGSKRQRKLNFWSRISC